MFKMDRLTHKYRSFIQYETFTAQSSFEEIIHEFLFERNIDQDEVTQHTDDPYVTLSIPQIGPNLPLYGRAPCKEFTYGSDTVQLNVCFHKPEAVTFKPYFILSQCRHRILSESQTDEQRTLGQDGTKYVLCSLSGVLVTEELMMCLESAIMDNDFI